MKIVLYHGSPFKFDSFKVLNLNDAVEQNGPGVYLTTSEDEAKRYSQGNYIYKVEWTYNKILGDKEQSKSALSRYAGQVKKAFMMLDKERLETVLSNWGENSKQALNSVIETCIDSAFSEKDVFINVWAEGYMKRSVEFCSMMTKLGYDGHIIKFDGVDHIIAYNPENLKILEVKKPNMNEAKYIAYHGTGAQFKTFSLKKATQGIIWFTDDKTAIEAGEVGAQGKGRIIKCEIELKNPCGWDEYEKYGIGQLKGMGYDGIILPDNNSNTYIVFETKQIKMLKEKSEVFYVIKDTKTLSLINESIIKNKKYKTMTKQEIVRKVLKELKAKGLLNEAAIKKHLKEDITNEYGTFKKSNETIETKPDGSKVKVIWVQGTLETYYDRTKLYSAYGTGEDGSIWDGYWEEMRVSSPIGKTASYKSISDVVYKCEKNERKKNWFRDDV